MRNVFIHISGGTGNLRIVGFDMSILANGLFARSLCAFGAPDKDTVASSLDTVFDRASSIHRRRLIIWSWERGRTSDWRGLSDGLFWRDLDGWDGEGEFHPPLAHEPGGARVEISSNGLSSNGESCSIRDYCRLSLMKYNTSLSECINSSTLLLHNIYSTALFG